MTMEEFGYMPDSIGAAADASELISLVLGIYLVLMLPLLAFTVVSYVLQSLGMQGISKRRGIHHSWLSWLPVGNMWILGSISDQYQYVAKGKIRSRRKVLLGLMVAMFALMIVMEFSALAAMAGAATSAVTGAVGDSLAGLMIVVVLALVLLAVSVVATVFQYIVCYDLFVSCDPNNATVFLVLGILFPVTIPFFIFACRKKDLGMPPRKAQPAVEPAAEYPVYLQEPVVEATREPVAEESDFEEPARFVPEDE